MVTAEVIDVTALEPHRRHAFIFDRFDSLKPGESLVISNDHDPQPLYYQLQAKRGPVADWVYLQRGPERWQVMITRKANLQEETIGEMVTKDLRRAAIFRKYNIDFCCGGQRTLQQVCRDKNIDAAVLQNDLDTATAVPSHTAERADEWKLAFLADYIINIHHRYVRKTMPDIMAWAEKVERAHGERHPETITIRRLFGEVAGELTSHMMKEEDVLFPFIRSLEEANVHHTAAPQSHFGTVANPIRMMEHEHEAVGELLMTVRNLAGGYTPPADACNTFRALYAALKAFEDDLFLHIHLENNILFPKAKKLEEAFARQ